MRMVPSSQHYHDIFKCLRDEILQGGKRKISTKETIKEGDDGYAAYISTEAEGYYDLDEERKRKERKGNDQRRPTTTLTNQNPEERDSGSDYYYDQDTAY